MEYTVGYRSLMFKREGKAGVIHLGVINTEMVLKALTLDEVPRKARQKVDRKDKRSQDQALRPSNMKRAEGPGRISKEF